MHSFGATYYSYELDYFIIIFFIFCLFVCFVWFDSLCPSQQFFSNVGMGSSWVEPVLS